jgi:hypothetical protein
VSRKHKGHAGYLHRRALYKGKPCAVPGCTRLVTHNLGTYCVRHADRMRRYGNATGSAIAKHHLKAHRNDLRLFLRLHKDHRGLQAGLRVIRDWLADIQEGKQDAPGYMDAVRLIHHGVEALDILTEAAACYLYIEQHSAHYRTRVEIVKQLGTAVLRLAPRRKRGTWKAHRSSGGSYVPIGGNSRREVGELILTNLSGLLVNIGAGLQAAKQLAEQDKHDMLHMPFAVERPDIGKEGDATE